MAGGAGGCPSPITALWVSLSQDHPSLGEDRQFLVGDSWLEVPENPPSLFIGRVWVVNVPSRFLEQSLYSWLLKIML